MRSNCLNGARKVLAHSLGKHMPALADCQVYAAEPGILQGSAQFVISEIGQMFREEADGGLG